MTHSVKLQPWPTPSFVVGEPSQSVPSGPVPRGLGTIGAAPTWPLCELDASTLAELCDTFRAEVFRKAGKADPAKTP